MLNQYRYSIGQFQINFGTFQLSGSDAFSFLQKQTTYDIRSLPSNHFHLGSFLDSQGRVECYGHLMRDEDVFYYLVPELIKDLAKERLSRFLVSEDVEISEGESRVWTILLGPQIRELSFEKFFQGEVFNERAYLIPQERVADVAEVSFEDRELWRGVSGWPDFSGKEFKKEIINNTRLFDLSVSTKKGCYPGQETVSKIATNRGAAYAPVLLEVTQNISPGEIENFGKKIGVVGKTYNWNGKKYLEASILRDFRVSGLKISFSSGDVSETGIVHYYPLLPGDDRSKAEELYYQAIEFFKKDNNEAAEAELRLAIEIDPQFADAYESLGVLLGREERFIEAADIMRKLIEVDCTSVLAHTNLSMFLMRLGKIEEAEEQKSLAAVKSFQKFGEEARQKEHLEQEQKIKQEEWNKRESMFLQVLEIDEEDTLANYGVGSIAVEKGDWAGAQLHLEKVLRFDSQYSVAYLALGKAYLGLGKREEAIRIWSDGVKVAASKGDLMPANQMQSELEKL